MQQAVEYQLFHLLVLQERDKILMLAKCKLNSIEKLISKALSDMEISHEEFIVILDEKDRYQRMKYKLISENENNNNRLGLAKSFLKK